MRVKNSQVRSDIAAARERLNEYSEHASLSDLGDRVDDVFDDLIDIVVKYDAWLQDEGRARRAPALVWMARELQDILGQIDKFSERVREEDNDRALAARTAR